MYCKWFGNLTRQMERFLNNLDFCNELDFRLET